MADELTTRRRSVVTLLTIGIWIVIFVAGLWPFNFVPGNRIRWLPERGGLSFDDYGQVYGPVPMFLPRKPDAVAGATVELIFTPSESYENASTVFSLLNQDEVNFAIGQSVTDLFLEGSFVDGESEQVRKLWIDYVCGRAKELFVTAALDTRRVDVYLDGRLARSFPVQIRADSLSGVVLVGHNVKGKAPWNGSVARVAILEGTLDATEISQRYEQWTRTRHLDRVVNHRGAAYEFVAPATDVVSNIGETGPDLILPRIFRLRKSTVLERPGHFDRWVALDAVVNIVGFIPFGLTSCLCLRFWTRWGLSRCVVVTILVGASVSLVIEVLQVVLPTRDSSLADVVTNIVGTAIGAGATVIMRRAGRASV
jgi:VanZ like protein